MNKPTKNQANAVREYLASIGHEISHVQALEVIARGAGYRSRHAVCKGVPTTLVTQSATAVSCPLCKKCGTPLDGAYCDDVTCPYSDWPQTVDLEDLYTMSVQDFEKKYGKVKRQDLESLSEDIRQDYWDSGRDRRDLEVAIKGLLSKCADLFAGEESAVEFLMEEPEDDADDERVRAEDIKAEYRDSRRHADDVDDAVTQLLAECPGLYSDRRLARDFILDETDEQQGDHDFVVQVESDLFGNEVFTYYTEEERRAGIIRLMNKAVELNDGVTRRYYFSDVDSNIEKNSDEYDQALQARELEGEIVEGVVFYQKDRIGTIEEITDGGLTLHSWIDDNP